MITSNNLKDYVLLDAGDKQKCIYGRRYNILKKESYIQKQRTWIGDNITKTIVGREKPHALTKNVERVVLWDYIL